jgi:hypothetical protein
VQQGLDPLAVVRDPDHGIIDTKLQMSLQGVDGASFREARKAEAAARQA